MTRRWIPLLALLALPLAAEEPEPADAVKQAATALGNGDAAGFVARFDPSMPGLAALGTAVEQLLRYGDVQSTIQFGTQTGSGPSRSLALHWALRIQEREGSHALTNRQADVTCRVELAGGQWRIAGFEPRDFFATPHVEGAWDLLESAAAALSNGNAEGFLGRLSPSMPGYDQVREGVLSMVALGEVQSSIDLLADEGTDASRAIEVDWTLRIVTVDTTLQRAAREEHVKCRVELADKHWRITGLDPAEFFRAFLLRANFPHQGEDRRLLID